MAKYNITEKKEHEAKYRSLVNPEMMDTLKEKILRIIVIQEKYKDKEYSAKQLAMDLGTNTRYVSAVINVKFHTNYSCFVNKYRIDEAMSLMVDRRYQKLTMEQISDMVGFSNRQSFYASFYRIMNMSPRVYRVKFLEQHPSQKVENQKKDRSSK
ncbi:AraC family transcriptional regulator [Prevotella brevis]|uniref:AraC family transcriptional regulator n=1 Tax=Xylanibacter brevis TaxID=83231 RepID=A0ABS9CFT7_9BACT|nr:helix-turn-helix domain-containing protein [Xylanibacter brevis]MCF2563622.1 AraC family transcriptional regulator [Xylanibacter brevis]